MTGWRLRLSRLEAQQRDSAPGEMLGVFEADAAAGVWREQAGGMGRTLPLEDQEEAAELAATGGVLLMYAPHSSGRRP